MKIYDTIPEQVNLGPIEFLKWLGEPSIITAGTEGPAIVMSCLIHGNEPSGFYAIHNLLKELYKEDFLKKKIYFIFVNIRAALQEPHFTKRHCDDESDMNRIWGNPGVSGKQNKDAEDIMGFLETKDLKLVLDFHNTTGDNPVFAITTALDAKNLGMCSFFCIVVFHKPGMKTFIEWSKKMCTSISVECGRNNIGQSHKNAEEVLIKTLVIAGAMDGKVEAKTSLKLAYDPTLVETITEDIAFSEINTGEDLVLRPDLDKLNMITIPKGTHIGWQNKEGSITHPVLSTTDKKITTNQDCTFSMMTTVVDVIKKDTLGYVVKTKELQLSKL
ncbi:succinylglutamate desuccinylase/aspartoacylase family protein [Nanoarchaeota archaeon]